MALCGFLKIVNYAISSLLGKCDLLDSISDYFLLCWLKGCLFGYVLNGWNSSDTALPNYIYQISY